MDNLSRIFPTLPTVRSTLIFTREYEQSRFDTFGVKGIRPFLRTVYFDLTTVEQFPWQFGVNEPAEAAEAASIIRKYVTSLQRADIIDRNAAGCVICRRRSSGSSLVPPRKIVPFLVPAPVREIIRRSQDRSSVPPPTAQRACACLFSSKDSIRRGATTKWIHSRKDVSHSQLAGTYALCNV